MLPGSMARAKCPRRGSSGGDGDRGVCKELAPVLHDSIELFFIGRRAADDCEHIGGSRSVAPALHGVGGSAGRAAVSYGALDLLLKHPSVFDGVAAFDFPTDMAAYDDFGSSSSAVGPITPSPRHSSAQPLASSARARRASRGWRACSWVSGRRYGQDSS